MSDLVKFWLEVGGIAAASCLVGYGIVRLSKRQRTPLPKCNAILRISSLSSIYRAHFIGEVEGGWAFTPPLQRDGYIPIKVGEPITIETIVDGGMAVYRTTLRERRTSMLLVDKPAFWHVDDRRDEDRIREIGHVRASLDGNKVGLVDMSACGARIRSQADCKEGERVRLEVNGFEEPIFGWVLDSDRKGDRYTIRMRFEEETDLAPLVVG